MRAFAFPVAIVLAVGSCREAAAPAPTGAARTIVAPPAQIVFAPVAGIVAANDEGTRITSIGGAQFRRRTLAGAEETASDLNTIVTLDGDGTAFGWTNDQKPFIWRPGQSVVVISFPEVGQQRLYGWGRVLGTGEAIFAISTYQPSVPAHEGVRLYRWSSVSGWQQIATGSPSPASSTPTIHGITADGSVIWSVFGDDDDYLNRIYRTAPGGTVIQYQAPPGANALGYQFVGAGTFGPNVIASDGAGRLVGRSYSLAGPVKPVIWAANGTGAFLPTIGSGHGAQIRGNYIVGTVDTDASSKLARWHWNGDSWDLETFAGVVPSSGPTSMNANGLIAYSKTNAPGGYKLGTPSGSEFFESDVVYSNGWVFLDAGGRMFTATGILTAEPDAVTPATATVFAGRRFTLPLSFSHTSGASAGPFTWSVKWSAVAHQTSAGVANEPGEVVGVYHTYNAGGSYTIRAVVVDAAGNPDTSFTSVTVYGASDAPSASVVAPETLDEGGDVVLDASASSDPNALALTYKWRFDGTGPGDVGAVLTRRNVPRGFHNWSVIVANSLGLADTASGTVDVLNVAPTARFVFPKAPVDQKTAFTLSVANVRDAAGDMPPNADINVEFDCGTGYSGGGTATSKECTGHNNPGTYAVYAKLSDQLNAPREYVGIITVKNRPPGIGFSGFAPRAGHPGQFRVIYNIIDGVNDGAWLATFQVNSEKEGGKVYSGTNSVGPWMFLTNGDVVTVRVRDKYGATSTATIVFSDG